MVGRGARFLSVALAGVLTLAGVPTGAVAEVASEARPRAVRPSEEGEQAQIAPVAVPEDAAMSCRLLLHRLGDAPWDGRTLSDPVLWKDGEVVSEETDVAVDAASAVDGLCLLVPGITGVRYRLLAGTGAEDAWARDGEPCVVAGQATGIEVELDDEAAARIAMSLRTCSLGPDGLTWGPWKVVGGEQDGDEAPQTSEHALVAVEVKVEELPVVEASQTEPSRPHATRLSQQAAEEAKEVTPYRTEQDEKADAAVTVEVEETSKEAAGAPAEADAEQGEEAAGAASAVEEEQTREPAGDEQTQEPGEGVLAAQTEQTPEVEQAEAPVPEAAVPVTVEQAPVQAARTPDVALSAQSIAWARLFGDTRYDTMAKIADTGFTSESVAVLTTGKNFPDALAASALAGHYGCPILLTDADSLGFQAASEIERLGVGHILILGGAGALSEDIEYELDELGVTHERLFGATRQETSLKVFEHLAGLGAVSSFAIVASGQSFADALSISPWAYANHVPILLTGQDGTLSDAEVAALSASNVTNVVIVGGEAVVSPEVETQLADFDGTRLSGADRYATSERIARFEEASGLGWEVTYVCTGKAFPDALAGSALAGSTGSILLIADAATDETLELLRERADGIDHGVIFGGPQAFPLDDPLSVAAPSNPGNDTETATDSDVGKRGYQNPEGFYQVSSKTVTISSQATAPWNYVTPSRISADATREDCVNAFIERAREYIGAPYVWNYACAPEVGVDCIGLVYQCAYACGMDLGGGTGDEDFNPWAHYITGYSGWHSHDANNFWDYGHAMHVSLEDRRPGDLISYPGHIGIYLGDDEMIHAYTPDTGVIYDSIWSPGTPRGCIRLFQ